MGPHRRQNRLVEGLAVRLAHVVGDLGEGQHRQGRRQQGRDGADLGARHPQGARQEGGGMGGHGALTAKLAARSVRRLAAPASGRKM
ncbi:hypothetical protein D3C77_292560 [compost metagenome]